jgi:FMN-dependent dehydrogenase
LLQRAEAASAEAIVLTVDAPGLGTRERDVRDSFRLPDHLGVENLAPLGKGRLPVVSGSGLAAYVRDNFKADLGFDDLDWLWHSTPITGGGKRRLSRPDQIELRALLGMRRIIEDRVCPQIRRFRQLHPGSATTVSRLVS